MKKTKELRHLYKSDGWIVAEIYDEKHYRYYSHRFCYYNVKEIIAKLRGDGVRCPSEACKLFSYNKIRV